MGQLSSALIDVGSDGFPEDHARATAVGIIRNDRNSIAVEFTEELHAEALMKCDGIEICRRGDRFDVPAAMRARKGKAGLRGVADGQKSVRRQYVHIRPARSARQSRTSKRRPDHLYE